MAIIQGVLLVLASLGLNYGFMWKEPGLAIVAGVLFALAIWVK